MIDSICLRVYNLKANFKMFDKLNEQFKTTSKLVSTFKNIDGYANTKIYGKLNSGINGCAYYVNEYRDFVEFNFSIPKYVYGTNVLEFIPSLEINGKRNRRGLIDNCLEVYKMLIEFLNEFFKQFEYTINNTLVEINRIDFCYNYYSIDVNNEFVILKKSDLFKGKNVVHYEDSILKKMKYKSYKWYKKGVEYAKNERLKHLKNGIDMQRRADKIIRYEATYRNKAILELIRKSGLYSPVEFDLIKAGWNGKGKLMIKKAYKDEIYTRIAHTNNKYHESIYELNFEIFQQIFLDFYDTLKTCESKKSTIIAKVKNRTLAELKKFLELEKIMTKQEMVINGLYNRQSIYRISKKIKEYGLRERLIEFDYSKYHSYNEINNMKI